MRLNRRHFLVAVSAVGLVGCMETEAPVLSVRAQSSGLMNPGLDGADRPVTISLLQMTSDSAFNSADYFALQNPSAALGGELVKSDTIVLAPGGTASLAVPILPTASIIGITAGFRDPAGRTVRTTVAVPASSSGLIITVGPSGIAAASA